MKKGISFVLVVLTLLASPMQAFASNWQTSQKDFTRNAVVSQAAISADLGVRWTKSPTLSKFQMPVYQDGILYFAEESSVADAQKTWSVYAVNKKTGDEIWRKNGTGLLQCSPTVSGDTIIIPGDNLIALDSKTGAEIWRRKADTNYFFVDPMISGGKLFVLERTIYYYGNLESIDISSGTLNWKKMIDLYSYSQPSFYKDNIIVVTGLSSNFSVVKSYKMSDGSVNWTYQHYYNPNGSVTVDSERGIGVLSLAVNSVVVINLDNGQGITGFSVGSYASRPILLNGIAYFITYQSQDTFFNACNYVTAICSVREKVADDLIYDFRIMTVLVGEKFYLASNKGKLYEINIGDGESKSYQIDESSVILNYAMYADGMLLLSDFYLKKLYVVGSAEEPIMADASIELESPYKADGEYHPYLGQLHSHYIPDVEMWSKLLNGDPAPSFTENKYQQAGYDFVALTEHNQIVNNPNISGIIHIADSEEDTQGQGGNHILAIGVRSPIDETLGEQARIDSVVNQGGVPILAHPNSTQYQWPLKKLMELRNYSDLEIFNRSVELWKLISGTGFSIDKWDSLLSSGKTVYGTAGDDYTPGDPGFDGGSVMVFSKSNNQSELLNNLRDGNFYALQGSKAPKISVLTRSNQITVNSDRQSTIRFISRGKIVQEDKNSATSIYTAVGNEKYVRIEIESDDKKSWSQPIWVNKKESAATPFPIDYTINFDQAILSVKKAAKTKVTTLSRSDYPSNSPQLGYIGQIYDVQSESALGENTNLSVGYKNEEIKTNEDNLSIYEYDKDTSEWQKIQSDIDKTNDTVAADITDSSLYVLSAEEPEDKVKPTVSLDDSIDLENFSGRLIANASDDNAVIKVSFYIDGSLVLEDSDGSDGWGGNIDPNYYSRGQHQLIVTADDLSGNIGQSEYQINIPGSSFKAPVLQLSTPPEGSKLWNSSAVAGNFVSSLSVEDVSIYIDNYFIDNAMISGDTFEKEINWSVFKEGNHVLKATLTDSKGNGAEVIRSISIKQKVPTKIISPNKSNYLQSDKIKFSFVAEDDGVIAKLDNSAIENGSERYGYDLGLGKHILTLEREGKIIARKELTITMSFEDLKKIVDQLYRDHHITNRGTYTMLKLLLGLNGQDNQSIKINLNHVTVGAMSNFVKNNITNKNIDSYGATLLLGLFPHLAK